MTQPARSTFLPGHVMIVIFSIIFKLSNVSRNIHLEQYERSYTKITIIAFLGILFLSYPLLGYIADVCLTRYRTIKCSMIFLIVGCTILLLMLLIAIVASLTELLERSPLVDENISKYAKIILALLGSTVVSPYVGMARKQNGGYNASISVQTLIFHLVVNSTRLKTVNNDLLSGIPMTGTVALRLLDNVVKVTNLVSGTFKIEFRHQSFSYSSH